MIIFIIAIILLLVGVGAFVGGFLTSFDDSKPVWWGAGVIAILLGLAAMPFAFYNKVSEGEVGIPVTFGQAGEPVGPGIQWRAPWTNIVTMSTKEQSIDYQGETAAKSRAKGGAEVTIDMAFTWELREEGASEIYRNVGTLDDLRDSQIRPISRDCIRDAARGVTPEEAATTGREQIKETFEDCMKPRLERYQVDLIRTDLRQIDPGEQVSLAIEAKTTAEQELQQREVQLEQQAVEAQRLSVEAFGTSNAERIISCGGREVEQDLDGDGTPENVIVPNDPCLEQFSDNYLRWLFLQNFADNDNLVFCSDATCSNVILDTGQRAATPEG